MENTIERIREMSGRIKALTAEDKSTIRAMLSEAGIEVKLDGKCRNCWIDAVLQLRNHYGITEAKAADGGWKYTGKRPTLIITEGSPKWYDENTTIEEIEKFVENNPKQTLFEK